MKALIGWIVAWLMRWFPHASRPGLRRVGRPDRDSPVIVTANFSLTVKRVLRALERRDLWVLVAPSGGINVWCASRDETFSHHSVIDAIKISRLAAKIDHRRIVLPALSAPSMDVKAIRDKTGFRARFGPVRARDIPDYLDRGMKKTEAMRRFRFDLAHRLDMLLSMNVIIYLPIAAVTALFFPQSLLALTGLFWLGAVIMYLLIDVIPGDTGWEQALFTAGAVAVAWGMLDWIVLGSPLVHWRWFILTFILYFFIGFDLAGIASSRRSDAVVFIARFGLKFLEKHYDEDVLGAITLHAEKCSGCGTCRSICPLGVFDGLDEKRKMTFRDRDACFTCRACVKQCPEGALESLISSPADNPGCPGS